MYSSALPGSDEKNERATSDERTIGISEAWRIDPILPKVTVALFKVEFDRMICVPYTQLSSFYIYSVDESRMRRFNVTTTSSGLDWKDISCVVPSIMLAHERSILIMGKSKNNKALIIDVLPKEKLAVVVWILERA